MRPSTFRSSQVAHANPSRTTFTTTSAFKVWIHQGSFSVSGTGLYHLHAILETVRVLLGDPDDAAAQAAVHLRAQLARRAVRNDAHGFPRGDSPRLSVVPPELDLGSRPLEGELRHPLDGGPAEEGAEADELEPRARRPARRHLRIRLRPGELVGGRQLGVLRRGRGRPGIDLDSEALAEPREPFELVRPRGNDGAPKALRPALQVDEGALALEVARAREDDVRPGGQLALEHRSGEDEASPLGELAHARVVGGLVAGDD